MGFEYRHVAARRGRSRNPTPLYQIWHSRCRRGTGTAEPCAQSDIDRPIHLLGDQDIKTRAQQSCLIYPFSFFKFSSVIFKISAPLRKDKLRHLFGSFVLVIMEPTSLYEELLKGALTIPKKLQATKSPMRMCFF